MSLFETSCRPHHLHLPPSGITDRLGRFRQQVGVAGGVIVAGGK